MTQEEKKLLLVDLCGRLPYKTKCKIENIENCYVLTNIDINNFTNISLAFFMYEYRGHKTEYVAELIQVKPYLRPMSSMTEEEEKEIQKINWQFYIDRCDNIAGCFAADDGGCDINEMTQILNYLNKHHFDYHGLIPMGLALEALKGMY